MNGHMIGKIFNVFTIIVPEDAQKKANLLPHYTLRIQFQPANGEYKDTFFLQLLDNSGEATRYQYVGLFNPNKGEVIFTARSPHKAESFEGQLFKKVLSRIFNGEIAEVQKAGFNILLGLPDYLPQNETQQNETIPGTNADDVLANILH